MDTLAFVKKQKEIDTAVKAGDFSRAYALVDELKHVGELSAVQSKLLARSMDLLERKSQRAGAVVDSIVRDPDANGISDRTPAVATPEPDKSSGRRYPAAPVESEALAALSAIESNAATQVSGLLRRLPQDDLADQIARRVLDLQRENQDLNIRLSQRMEAVPSAPPSSSKMKVITPREDEKIGAPAGPRTRIMRRREEVEEAAKNPGVGAAPPPKNIIMAGLDTSELANKGQDEEDEDVAIIPAKPSPASLRHGATMAPPPEHLEPAPPPPNWLTDPKFRKLMIIVALVVLVGAVLGGGYMAFSKQTVVREAHLDNELPSIGGFHVGDSYSSALDSFAAHAGEVLEADDYERSVVNFSSIGIKIKRSDGSDQIKEIQVSTVSGKGWPLFYGNGQFVIGAPIARETVDAALLAAQFQKVGGDENVTTTRFIKSYGKSVRATVVYNFGESGDGRIVNVILRKVGA